MEPRVRPGEHAGGLLLVEEIKADKEPEHRAAERFRQPRGIVGGPGDERPVGPKAAVGDEQMEVRMPVRPGAVRLQARDDPHGEVALAGQRAKMAAVTVRAATRAISPSRRRRYRQEARSRVGMVSTSCRCGTGASSVVSSHWVQMARRLA